jgi:tripartite-type tricarboxylate transporter receptor subunit TctC
VRDFLACVLIAFSSLALAQGDYPSRPIRLVVTVPPGAQAQGAEPMPGTPQAFASFMQEEMAKWAPVVKQAGVKLD